MNIQDECIKIHSQYGMSEMANYKIQLLFDSEIEKVKKEYEEKLRWIPVVEELKPKKDSKSSESNFSIYVLVKDIHGVPQSAYYNYKKKGFYSNAFSEHEIMCVTHWRYIFL